MCANSQAPLPTNFHAVIFTQQRHLCVLGPGPVTMLALKSALTRVRAERGAPSPEEAHVRDRRGDDGLWWGGREEGEGKSR